MRAIVPVLAVLSLAAGASTQRPPEPFVPVSVWFGVLPSGPAPAAGRSEWRRDLQAIRSGGFNSVRVAVEWAGSEAVRGTYSFEDLDELLTIADQTALRVIVQVAIGRAPEWLRSRYPDAALITDRGDRSPSGYCLDHPAVRADAAAFVGAVSARSATHQSFHAIDLSSDASVGSQARTGAGDGFCYCPHTRRRFREWLERKYVTIAALNRAWRRGFSSWERVEPPRRRSTPSAPDGIDWTTFGAARLREDLKMKADATAARGERPVTSHTGAPSVMAGPLLPGGAADDWWMSTAVDQYGLSAYSHGGSETKGPSPVRLAFSLDGVRSAARGRGWWASGVPAGESRGAAADGAALDAADLRVWAWTALSRGARAVGFGAWHPSSGTGASGGAGMIGADGALTRAARSSGEFADLLTRNAALFGPLAPRASRVAIVYNPLSYFAAAEGDAAGSSVRDSMLGFYRAMFERNIQTDFVHPDEIASGAGSNYQAIFLGYAPMLARTVAAALELYVRNGGTLVSEARPAWRDDRGDAGPPAATGGLDQVFGARAKAIRRADAVTMIAERDLAGALAPLAGAAIPGVRIAEHLEVTGPTARVLARFPGANGAPGDAAIVAATYGAGRAIRIGTFAAAALEQDPAARRVAGELLQQLVAAAGVRPEVRIDGGAGLVEARFLESADALLLIAINHGDTPQTVTMTFQPDAPEAIWQNMETGGAVNFVAGPDGPTYTRTFAARDVVVLMIRKRWR